jgi:hypothetical protein
VCWFADGCGRCRGCVHVVLHRRRVSCGYVCASTSRRGRQYVAGDAKVVLSTLGARRTVDLNDVALHARATLRGVGRTGSGTRQFDLDAARRTRRDVQAPLVAVRASVAAH